MISKDELVQLIHPNVDLTGKPKLQEAYRLSRQLIYKDLAGHVLDSSLTAYFERFRATRI